MEQTAPARLMAQTVARVRPERMDVPAHLVRKVLMVEPELIARTDWMVPAARMERAQPNVMIAVIAATRPVWMATAERVKTIGIAVRRSFVSRGSVSR